MAAAMEKAAEKDKELAKDCGITLGLAHTETVKVGGVIEQLTKQTEEADRRLDREVKAHQRTKEKSRATEEEYNRMQAAIAQERENYQAAQNRLAELDKFQGKSEAALKAMQDDLLAVKQQNEALQAELDVQKKAFAVSVRWEAMYAELKEKHDTHEREHESFYNQYIQRRNALDSAMSAQEECRSARDAVLEALERAKADMAQGEELMRAALECEEVAKNLGGMDELKVKLAKTAEARKAQRERAKAALSKSCNANDGALVGTIFGAWGMCTKGEKLQQEKKKQGHALSARAIANSASAIQDFALTAWYTLVQEEKAKKLKEANRALEEKCAAAGEGAANARRKALAQLEKQFGNAAKALLRDVHHAWVNLKMERLKVEKAGAVAARNIASCDSAIVTQVFQGWFSLLKEVQRKREKKASGMARGVKMIADGDNATKDFCLTKWAELTKISIAEKKQTEAGHIKCARMMASNNSGLTAQVFTLWAEFKQKLKDVEKKKKAVERNLAAMSGSLVGIIVKEWKVELERHKKSEGKKAVGMAQSAKKIAITTAALQMDIIVLWAKECSATNQAKLKAELEAKKSAPPVPDERMIQCQKDLAELVAKLRVAQETQQEILDRIISNEARYQEADAGLLTTERNLDKASNDLIDSRRKAKDINEELARVSAFLLSKPRKPSSRPTSGTKDNTLPRIAQGPQSAREHRPDSARSLKGSSIGGDPGPGGSTKQAWGSP